MKINDDSSDIINLLNNKHTSQYSDFRLNEDYSVDVEFEYLHNNDDSYLKINLSNRFPNLRFSYYCDVSTSFNISESSISDLKANIVYFKKNVYFYYILLKNLFVNYTSNVIKYTATLYKFNYNFENCNSYSNHEKVSIFNILDK